VIKVLADLIPDEEVQAVADKLTAVFMAGIAPESDDDDDAIAALDALAALDWRLPVGVAAAVLPEIERFIPREKHHYRFIDDALLAMLAVCAKYQRGDIQAKAVEGLIDSLRNDIGHAERKVVSVGSEIPGIVDGIRGLEGTEHQRVATQILANWEIATSIGASSVQDRIQSIIEEQIGVPKSTFTLGRTCTYVAIALDACMASSEIPPAEVDALAVQLDLYRDNMIVRVEDSHSSASERTDAAIALRVLAEKLSGDDRQSLFSRVMAVHDDPRLGAYDQIERANYLHPLARFKFGDGGLDFEAELLWTAAVLASTDEEKTQVTARLRASVAQSPETQEVAQAHARAAVALDADVLIPEFFRSQSALMRQAAAVLWAAQPQRDSHIGKILSEDSNKGVRGTLANSLVARGLTAEYPGIVETLSKDPSADVRHEIVAESEGAVGHA
jgi:hypothetical protein